MNTTEVGAIFGVKFASVIAGFAGSVVSLSFVKEMTPKQMGSAVIIGTVTAAYVTPLVAGYLSQYLGKDNAIDGGVAFLVGLCAMNILPGVLKISEAFRNKPLSFLHRDDGK